MCARVPHAFMSRLGNQRLTSSKYRSSRQTRIFCPRNRRWCTLHVFCTNGGQREGRKGLKIGPKRGRKPGDVALSSLDGTQICIPPTPPDCNTYAILSMSTSVHQVSGLEMHKIQLAGAITTKSFSKFLSLPSLSSSIDFYFFLMETQVRTPFHRKERRFGSWFKYFSTNRKSKKEPPR